MGDVLISTVLYGSGGGRPLSMHLLRPQPAPSRPAPALLFVHGGAFRHGSKDAGVGRLFPFARRGYVCASVEYRLSGEATWPAQIEDCKCAVRYLRAHAAELGLDPDRIGAWGPSAGGHLVAMLGLAPDWPELEGSGGWAEHSSRVQAVCDWFGPTDLLTMIEQPSTIDRSGSDYRTIAAREARLIEGQSMGGFGSAHLGFKYPRLFGAVSISAGALIDFAAAPAGRPDARRLATLESVWGGDPERFRADDPARLARANADQIRGRQRVRIFCGDQDRLLAQNARFHELLDELDIEHEYEVVPGAEHSYDSKLERLGIGHFAFFARALGERGGASA